MTDAKVEFGLVPKELWFQPDWIDENRASAARKEMVENNVIYGGQSLLPIIYCTCIHSHHRQRSVPQHVQIQLRRKLAFDVQLPSAR